MTDVPNPAPTPAANQPGFNFLTTIVNDLTGFAGNADVQKIVGLAGGAVLQTDFKTWAAKLASVGAGGLFALGVHYVDYLRAKVATAEK
jgi:hypothetical protein